MPSTETGLNRTEGTRNSSASSEHTHLWFLHGGTRSSTTVRDHHRKQQKITAPEHQMLGEQTRCSSGNYDYRPQKQVAPWEVGRGGDGVCGARPSGTGRGLSEPAPAPCAEACEPRGLRNPGPCPAATDLCALAPFLLEEELLLELIIGVVLVPGLQELEPGSREVDKSRTRTHGDWCAGLLPPARHQHAPS